MKTLYKFYADFSRSGTLEGLFVAEDSAVKKLIGKNIYFGEVLGKHSEVEFIIKDKYINVISTDPNVIDVIEKHVGSIGINPLDYDNEEDDNDIIGSFPEPINTNRVYDDED